MIHENLPSLSATTQLLQKIGAPTTPEEIGITDAELREGILYAKEVRDRYTLLQLLWDLGLSDKYAQKI